MTRTISNSEMNAVINECRTYAEGAGADERRAYEQELGECRDWLSLCSSGVFHDAVGKVVSLDAGAVVVTDEY